MIRISHFRNVSLRHTSDILSQPITLQFNHRDGTIHFTGFHDDLVTTRACFFHANDYPESPLPIHPNNAACLLNLDVYYTDIGGMVSSGNKSVLMESSFNSGEIIITVSPFHFDTSKYIKEDDDGDITYIEPEYSYYNGKSKVRLILNRDIIEDTCRQLDSIMPYRRFDPYNAQIFEKIYQK